MINKNRCKKINIRGKKNPNYKDGRTLTKYFCKCCNALIKTIYKPKTMMCLKCLLKSNQHPAITHGKSSKNTTPCCSDCKIKISDYRAKRCRPCFNKWFNGKVTPQYGKIRQFSPVWKGGKSFEKYGLEWDNKLKSIILKRDKYRCQLCGEKGTHVHHIDYNKHNCNEENLITLCIKCHSKTNFIREAWINLFISKNYKNRKTPLIIMTAGSFDLAHYGHINVLKQAKALGDYLIVGVSTDSLISKHKGIKPIICYKDRISIIKELKCVDKVVKQEKLVDIKQFKSLKADLFVVGDDWKNRKDNPGINWLRDNNKIAFIPYTKRLSSSKIKEKIIRNAVEIIKSQSKGRK